MKTTLLYRLILTERVLQPSYQAAYVALRSRKSRQTGSLPVALENSTDYSSKRAITELKYLLSCRFDLLALDSCFGPCEEMVEAEGIIEL